MQCLKQTIYRSTWSKSFSTLLKHVKRDEKKEVFLSAFPEVVASLMNCDLYSKIPNFLDHYSEVIEYNVLKEKRFRPSIILDTYKTLELEKNLSDHNLHLANILAWCVELLHTSIIVNDDIMDCSQLRASEIPWYRKENVGLNAINDGMLILEGAFILLKKYFSAHRAYLPLLDVFRYINMAEGVGQSLDWKCNAYGKPVFEHFNLNTYMTTIRYKGCIPFVEGPFRAGLILSNHGDEKTLKEVIDVVIKLGESFQIDNDILDLYDNGNVRDQKGNDIIEGKCTWLAVQVLQNGNQNLQKTFKQNYGRSEKECENTIIDIYETMNLYGKYSEYKKDTLRFVHDRIKLMTKPTLKQTTLTLAENVFS